MPIPLPLIGPLFATWGAFFKAVIINVAFTAGMWGITKLAQYLRANGRQRTENAGPNYIIRSAVVPARWILGTARVGSVLFFYRPVGRDAFMVLGVAEGELEGLEAIIVNGKKLALEAAQQLGTDDGRLFRPAVGDEFRDKILFFEHFKGDGTQGVQFRNALGGSSTVQRDTSDDSGQPDGNSEDFDPYSDYFPFEDPPGSGLEFDPLLRQPVDRGPEDDYPGQAALALSMPWTAAHKLNGISWVGVRLMQPDYGTDYKERFWSHLPDIEFIVKGSKITWLGQDVATWTENAAALRYWWETVRRGRTAAQINTGRFNAAYTLCNEDVEIPASEVPAGYNDFPRIAKRYAINGLVTSGDDVSRIEQQFDACWCGHVIESSGELRFEPGTDRTPEFSLGADDLAEEPIVFPWTAIHQRVNAIKADLAQSSVHDYGPLSLREFKDSAAIARDGETRSETAPLDFVSDPLTGGRISAVLLRQSRESMRLQVRAKPGDLASSNSPLRWRPLSVVLLTLPKLGLNASRFYVEAPTVNTDFTVSGMLREDLTGTYATTLVLPAIKEREIVFPERVPAPYPVGVRIDEIARLDRDGKTVIFLVVKWEGAPTLTTEVRIREKAGVGETEKDWVYHESKTRYKYIPNLVAGLTYQVQVRHLSATQTGSAWLAFEHLVAGDLMPPSALMNWDVDFREAGFRATWTVPADQDLKHIEIWVIDSDADGNQPAGRGARLALAVGDQFETIGLYAANLRKRWARARPVDFSGNLGPWTAWGEFNPAPPNTASNILAGSGDPNQSSDSTVTDAAAGSLYVQDNGHLWIKGMSAWVDSGVDLTGSEAGLYTVSGANPPAVNVGVDGDVAVSLTDGTVWEKVAGSWDEVGDLTGPGGSGSERIYRLTALGPDDNGRPATPPTSADQRAVDGFVPVGWLGPDPPDLNPAMPFRWGSRRFGSSGNYGAFQTPFLDLIYSEPFDSGGEPLAPAVSVEVLGAVRAGYQFRVDIGFQGSTHVKGVVKAQLQVDDKDTFADPIAYDVELSRPPLSHLVLFHGYRRVYFRARLYNQPGDEWSPWSATINKIGHFVSDDTGVSGAVRELEVVPAVSLGGNTVRFVEPETNARNIWAYEIQARTRDFLPGSIVTLLGAVGLRAGSFGTQLLYGGNYTPGTNLFSVPGQAWSVNEFAGKILYLHTGIEVSGTVRTPASYPILSNTAATLTLDVSETYGLPSYARPAGGYGWLIWDGWTKATADMAGDYLAVLDRAHAVTNIPQASIHPDRQRFEFTYQVNVPCAWRVRAKNLGGFGPWSYFPAVGEDLIEPSALVPEEITVRQVSAVATIIDIESDLDLDGSEILGASAVQTSRLSSSGSSVEIDDDLDLDDNDLLNGGSVELETLTSGDGVIALSADLLGGTLRKIQGRLQHRKFNQNARPSLENSEVCTWFRSNDGKIGLLTRHDSNYYWLVEDERLNSGETPAEYSLRMIINP